jgi:hypothetical protein
VTQQGDASLGSVRGAGDPLTVGERIAFYRRRRGLAQSTLAEFGVTGGMGVILTTWYVVRRRKYLEDEKKRSDEIA